MIKNSIFAEKVSNNEEFRKGRGHSNQPNLNPNQQPQSKPQNQPPKTPEKSRADRHSHRNLHSRCNKIRHL